MAHVATHIDKDDGVRMPSLGFLFNWIYVPTYRLVFATVTHVFVERTGRLRVLCKPREGRQCGFMGRLKSCVVVVCDILVADLVKKIGERLVYGTEGVESEESNHDYLQPPQDSGFVASWEIKSMLTGDRGQLGLLGLPRFW